MSTATKLGNLLHPNAFAKAFEAATAEEKLVVVQTVRKMYVKAVASTEVELDPQRLRNVDAGIAKLKSVR
jgi:hypothetical protein